MIVVSDSGPLIALSKLSLLSLLHELFAEIVIPMEVWMEVVERGKGKPGSDVVEKAGFSANKKIPDLRKAAGRIRKSLGVVSINRGKDKIWLLRVSPMKAHRS